MVDDELNGNGEEINRGGGEEDVVMVGNGGTISEVSEGWDTIGSWIAWYNACPSSPSALTYSTTIRFKRPLYAAIAAEELFNDDGDEERILLDDTIDDEDTGPTAWNELLFINELDKVYEGLTISRIGDNPYKYEINENLYNKSII